MALPAKKNFDIVLDAHKGMFNQPQNLIADDAVNDSAVTGDNVILPGINCVVVTTTTNDANDFIVLPDLSDVPDGYMISVSANASSNFEVRTVATSNQQINGVDSDGTNEFLVRDTEVVTFMKVDGSVGWQAKKYTQTGEVGGTLLATAEHGAGAIGTGTILAPRTYRLTENDLIITTIKIDLTGLGVKGSSADDVIGLVSGAPDAYIGKYLTATYGIVYKVTMACIELPAGSNTTTDINLTVSGTGTFGYDEGAGNDYIFNTGALVAEQMLENIAPTTLTNDDFIYLTEGDTAAATGVYTAGQYIITFYGHPLLT